MAVLFKTEMDRLETVNPEQLGDTLFKKTHGVRFAYIVGEMANGIATAEMVIRAANAGMLGFFGAAGLMPEAIEDNIHKIQSSVQSLTHGWGSNLIYSPQELHLEEAVVNLYLRRGVTTISASAYMGLTPALVRYALTGLSQDVNGNIIRKNKILAKLSRPEVAKPFMSPAPQEVVNHLLSKGELTEREAALSQFIPMAEDITAEADSGGHTDNRPLTVLFPVLHRLANTLSRQYGYQTPIRVGAAGGLGSPEAVAAAFSMGAAYVLTGSVNQAAVESGLSSIAKTLLAEADFTDVAMAPAADMFELGVKLQVLKRGTLFAMRATKLYEWYSTYGSLEALPPPEKNKLETQILGASVDEIWKKTQEFFHHRDPKQIAKAEKDPKHRMALVFRWYLGLSSQWAIQGVESRKMDYQIWCGPAMGAFNRWVEGTYLAPLSARTVSRIGRHLMIGAARILHAQALRSSGVAVTWEAYDDRPTPLSDDAS